MLENLLAVFIIVIVILLLVVLTFLYKLTVATGRLQARLEQVIAHLRGLDIAESAHPSPTIFGLETELQHANEDLTDSGIDKIQGYTPTSDLDSDATVATDRDVHPSTTAELDV